MRDEFIDIYKELTIAAHRAYTRGIQTGSGGNLSARLSNNRGMIVKSSGGSFIDCDEGGTGWIAMEYSGKLLRGEKGKPTREWVLHKILLEHIQKCGAVVHTHSPYLVAWADQHEKLPMITRHSQLKVDCEIPVLDIPAAVVPEREALHILELFNKNDKLPAIILKGHGVVAIGNNAIEAEHMVELLEETAQIAVLQYILNLGGK